MLKGKKIYLRKLERKDIRILYDIANEENVKKYNNILNQSMINNTNQSNDSINLRKALSIINEKNVLVGFITYKESSCCKNVYSIGITIGSRYWNRGYGKDSIMVLVEYLFNDLKAIRIILEVAECNLRAINCYKKCGFLECGRRIDQCYIDDKYVNSIIMVLSK